MLAKKESTAVHRPRHLSIGIRVINPLFLESAAVEVFQLGQAESLSSDNNAQENITLSTLPSTLGCSLNCSILRYRTAPFDRDW